MRVDSNTYVKFGISGVSCLSKRRSDFSGGRSTCLRNFPRQRNLLTQGYIYTKMSSRVLEKVDVKESGLPNSASYETAMEALSSLITKQRRGEKSLVDSKYDKLERMSMYLQILGLEDHLAGLKIIHVAGTKGKGSTCTFCEAILRECGFRTGLFTSPHLIDVRERIRINGLEMTEDKFLRYFWDCWHMLQEKVSEDLPMPPLFQFLTVLAFKIFTSEQVDVAIIEVGLGGKRDSTNVIKEPLVCGITSLGLDHTESLGTTLPEIAAHKAGIFKPKIPAFTVSQLPEAMDVIEDTASELMVPLSVATPLDRKMLKGKKLRLSGDHQLINAGLAVSLCKCWLQRTGNWEKLFKNDNLEADLPEPFLRGLSSANILGRAQIIHDISSMSYDPSIVSESPCGDLIFYLDGAHSPESMEACAKWFSGVIKEDQNSYNKPGNLSDEVFGNGRLRHEVKNMNSSTTKISKQILLFNCMATRDPQVLLPQLLSTCSATGTHFSKALFVPSMSAYNKVTSAATVIPSDAKDLSWQFGLHRIWEKLVHGKEVDASSENGMDMESIRIPPHEFLYDDDASTNSAIMPSLPLTLKWLRDCVNQNPSLRLQVLVTGSLHMVGDVLKLLKR